MKYTSVFAVLACLALPAYAADDVPSPIIKSVAEDIATEHSNEIVKEEVAATKQLTDAQKQALKQEFKDEIKAELKQEYKDKKHSREIAFPHGLQIGVGLSATGGLNGFVGYANKKFDSFWAKRFGVRFDFATTSPVRSVVNDAIDAAMGDGFDIGNSLSIIDGTVDATHYAVMVDFYPFGDTWFLGGLRLSGGYYMGDMEMSANVAGTFNGPADRYEFELAGQQYAYTGNTMNATADLDWNYRGPYVGAGFDLGLFAGVKLYLDAGVVFTNRAAQLSLNIDETNLQQLNNGTWESADVAELDTAIAKTLADAQDELNDYKFYPIIKLGVMYRF